MCEECRTSKKVTKLPDSLPRKCSTCGMEGELMPTNIPSMTTRGTIRVFKGNVCYVKVCTPCYRTMADSTIDKYQLPITMWHRKGPIHIRRDIPPSGK